MQRSELLRAGAAALGLALLPGRPRASGYPSRPLRLLVGFPAGSASDVRARLAAQHLAAALGQPAVTLQRHDGLSLTQRGRAKAPGWSAFISFPANNHAAVRHQLQSSDKIAKTAPSTAMKAPLMTAPYRSTGPRWTRDRPSAALTESAT